MDDPQLGVFIHKHLRAIALKHEVVMVYVGSVNSREIDGFSVEKMTKDKLTIITVQYNAKSKSIPLIGTFLNWRKYNEGLRLALDQIEDKKFDLVHAHVLLRSAFYAYKLAKRINVPLIVSEHWHGFLNGEFEKRSWYWKYLGKKVLKEADAVHVVSKGMKRNMLDKKLVDKSKIKVIANVVDKNENTPPKLSAKDGKWHLLTVADLSDPIKNITGSIQSLAKYAQKNNHFVFHLVGDGPDRNKILAAAEANLKPEQFAYHGRLENDQVLEQIQQMDAALINSRKETFSVFAAEAIMHGLPVVSTKCGGPEEFITNKHGELVKVGDQESLIEALDKIRNHPENYQANDADELGFTEESISKKFDKLYRKVASNYLETASK